MLYCIGSDEWVYIYINYNHDTALTTSADSNDNIKNTINNEAIIRFIILIIIDTNDVRAARSA